MPDGFGAGSLTPEAVSALPSALHDAIVDAYANALAPAFWYLVPLSVLGFIVAFFMREVTLSKTAGLVAARNGTDGDGTGA
ncbi:hypothetical protein R2Q81_13055 [Microbacterium aquimaris]|uniref:hypothetical protein n=1 Tax=Microbacterium aquimaris TaxID=459816 RepID=UPI002AD2FBA9|nr:hypothetical protein [Microbacterium aquimaris]MDZ8276868.1 hypothetical protein [Microbacterium aquimaris]